MCGHRRPLEPEASNHFLVLALHKGLGPAATACKEETTGKVIGTFSRKGRAAKDGRAHAPMVLPLCNVFHH